ncbi:MAG: murein biosynthesis integral membrane protein MurJ [bacterium]|nr:murein biosynthesis integral membrane protein MurJ [bacterium]
MSEKRKVIKAAGVVGALTLLSRFTGVIRDAVLAAKLGDTRLSDVFFVAFELPNLVRRVLGEGALSSFIVPLFSERRKLDGEQRGWEFINRAGNVMMLVALAITVAGMFFSREVFYLFGGYGMAAAGDAGYVALGAQLTRLMFPFVIALTVGSVMMGACHTLRSFAAPSLGSVMLNLTMIIGAGLAIILRTPGERATVWLGWAVLAGVALRVLIMVPTLRRHGWRWQPVWSPSDPAVRRLMWLMVPGLAAMGISQINSIVSGQFAMYLGKGIKTYLLYAGRLIQFPMALTATAAATAMLPQLSHYLLEGQSRELRDLMAFTKRIEIVLMTPAMVGLIFLGLPITELIFAHGRMTTEGAKGIYWALLFYAPGLLPLGWCRLLEPLFYARQDRLTPLKAAAVSMALNMFLNWLFAFHTHLAQGGLALANTLASFAYYFILAGFLGRVLERPMGERPRIAETFWKSLAASVVACGAAAGLYWAVVHWLGAPGGTLTRAALLLPVLAVAAALYFVLAHALHVPDSHEATGMIMARLRRKKE